VIVLRAAWLAVAGAIAIAESVVAASEPKTHAVTIENMQFSPATLTVAPGERIVWTNQDLFPHTATADDGAFDSKAIAAQAQWTFLAGKSGEYAYGCTFHPTMKARLIVR
jgi:plastocyanin